MENVYDTCLVCGCENVEPSHFWKEHRISEKDYCFNHLPRRSKLTGKLLSFKSRDFYFNSQFENKNELKKWLSEHPDEEGLEYAISILKTRFDQGKIQFAPSQVELKSIVAPNILWYEKFGKNYNLICSEIGLQTRFLYKDIPSFAVNDKLPITIDTREQKELKFQHSIINKLDYGDYWAADSKWNHVYIERKSITDFVGTLSSGYERFEREIIRAAEDNKYLFVLVEEELNKALSFNYLPHVSSKIKASPEFVFKRVRDLMQKFSNIQFLFADGRKDSVDLVHKIYGCDKDPSLFDFQYLKDIKTL
jgi:ERCC4 domain-containing protein